MVLGYEDPQLTNVARDSPTLTCHSPAKHCLANKIGFSSLFDMGLRPEEVCELVGNAYGRVDAPLLFYRELKSQLFKLGLTIHPLDPYIFLLESTSDTGRILHGILGVHVDDGLCGGDSKF